MDRMIQQANHTIWLSNLQSFPPETTVMFLKYKFDLIPPLMSLSLMAPYKTRFKQLGMAYNTLHDMYPQPPLTSPISHSRVQPALNKEKHRGIGSTNSVYLFSKGSCHGFLARTKISHLWVWLTLPFLQVSA